MLEASLCTESCPTGASHRLPSEILRGPPPGYRIRCSRTCRLKTKQRLADVCCRQRCPGAHGLGILHTYRPPQVDRIWLWVYYNRIPIYITFYLPEGDYTLNPQPQGDYRNPQFFFKSHKHAPWHQPVCKRSGWV